MRRAAWSSTAGLAVLVLIAGCHARRAPSAAPVPPQVLAARPLAMMLPLANLTGRLEDADAMSRVFYGEFARVWPGSLVDYGEAARLADEARLRDTASPSSAQVRALRDSSGAAYLLVGTVLESGTVRAPEGDIPSVGVALRLIDTSTLRAVWADSRFGTGQDRESVFGWGRETQASRLTSRLAEEMFRAFQSASQNSRKGDVP